MSGQRFGSYMVVRRLGEGGIGTLFAVQHAQHGFPAALRLLRPEFNYPEQIFAPWHAATQTGYWGICNVLDRFTDGAAGCVVSELIEGESLAVRLDRERKFAPDMVIWLSWQLASTLAAAHAVGVVHRLIRPHNVMLVRDPQVPFGVRVKVVDFGVSTLFGDKPNFKHKQTVSGIGPPHYVAPEWLRGDKVDARADIYSLAALAYRMLVGRPPFPGDDPAPVIKGHLDTAPPSPRAAEPSVPAALDQLIVRNLAKQPSARAASMYELVGDLERMAQSSSPAAAHAIPTMAFRVGPGGPPPQTTTPSAPGEQKTIALGLPAFVKPKHAPRKRWPIWVAVVALGVVGGGAAALLAGSGGGGGGGADAGAGSAAANPEAAPHVASPAEPYLHEADQALKEERWVDAAAAARNGHKADPKNEIATKLEKQATAELANQKLYDDFLAAVKAGDTPSMARRFRRIPGDSVYRGKAQPDYDRLRATWLKPRLDEAAALATQHACKRIPAVAKKVAAVFPESKADIDKTPCAPK